ncbi:hypothetical protein [Francisella sp. 19X1-34]|uniref:hypothetical protein n=1 Tax=Francisella sp. 19X1-34 TaxID=3087177 RepID=UPI002E357C4C|nr:hypothetical protein [Francisella sp. 19X1-34]MED7788483.1 hypothetical protein [Francisella sp. 19X1-34]
MTNCGVYKSKKLIQQTRRRELMSFHKVTVVKIIKGAKHTISADQPETFYEELISFVDVKS